MTNENPTVKHREPYLMHCGDLDGKKIQKGGGVIYIHIYTKYHTQPKINISKEIPVNIKTELEIMIK